MLVLPEQEQLAAAPSFDSAYALVKVVSPRIHFCPDRLDYTTAAAFFEKLGPSRRLAARQHSLFFLRRIA